MEKILITGVGSGMQGVGRLEEGCAAFVPGALPGEEAEIEITKRAPAFLRGAPSSRMQSFA